MGRRGLVGVALLWFLLAVSSLSLALLYLARWQQAKNQTHLHNIKILYLSHAAALMAYDLDLDFHPHTFDFPSGTVRMEVTPSSQDPTRTTLDCWIKTGPAQKRVQVGWKKVGAEWRAVYWKEKI